MREQVANEHYEQNDCAIVKRLRRIHTYLGCFFAPLLFFFCFPAGIKPSLPTGRKATVNLAIGRRG